MSVEFLFKIILVLCFNYYLTSRFLYAYEINGVCSTKFTLDIKKVFKNDFCKKIFPREFKNYRESLEGTSRISVIGLLHCIIFYFIVQMAYVASLFVSFVNEQVADKISTITFKVMFFGYSAFLITSTLVFIIDYIKQEFTSKQEGKK